MKPIAWGVGIAVALGLAWKVGGVAFANAVAAQEWDRAEAIARQQQLLRAVGHGSVVVLVAMATVANAQES